MYRRSLMKMREGGRGREREGGKEKEKEGEESQSQEVLALVKAKRFRSSSFVES